MVAHNHGEHGKDLDVRNNLLVSYINSQGRTERERILKLAPHILLK